MQRKNIVTSLTLALGLVPSLAFSQFVADFKLSDLNGLNGIVFNGSRALDNSGRSVSSAGDINGDGIDDLIIGATGRDFFNRTDIGGSYVVFGSDNMLPSTFNLSALNGSNGFNIFGVTEGDEAGVAVSAAGDINGDGIDDLIIGASRTSLDQANYDGSAYVVYGSVDPHPNPFFLANLNGSNGFAINAAATGGELGTSVSAAGDVNGDGFDDIILGAAYADSIGSSYVVFGSDQPLPNPLNLSTLDGNNGFELTGEAADTLSGHSVSAAGDINGDGVDDLIIGAPLASPGNIQYAGKSYVVYGSADPFPNPFSLSTLNRNNGFAINGTAEFDQVGITVSAAGDVNGDGVDDLIIGTNGAGWSYVVFGSENGVTNPLRLSTLDGTNGFAISGVVENNRAGSSVSAAGDINADGIDDVIIGANGSSFNGNDSHGRTYVVYGSETPFSQSFELSSLNGLNGFSLRGVNQGDHSGGSVSAAGDFNNDGIDDLIIGARSADPGDYSSAGSSYVVFGKTELIFADGFEN